MSSFSKQYDELLEAIIMGGVKNDGLNVRTVWKDGEPAYTQAVWGWMFRLQPKDGFPILTKKFVNPKSFSSEILWIMQKASNIVEDARQLGTNVWNEWEKEDGTIKKAYGYQIANNTYRVDYEKISEKSKMAIGKEFLSDVTDKDKTKEGKDYYRVVKDKGNYYVYLNQIDYVIQQLIDNTYSRQTITTLMNPKEFHEMALPPCVWSSHWEVMGDGKLYLSVQARSSDTFLGLPFNISQYALLHRLIAHVVGREIGDFIFKTDDAHLYDRHIPVALEYLKEEERELPEFWLDKNITSFQEFEYEKNFGWVNYTRDKYPVLHAPIAIGRGELKKVTNKNN